MRQPLTLLLAVAHEEGFFVPGSRAARNNNPGNLNYEPWQAVKYGAVLETVPHGYNETPRFAAFKTAADGFSAARELLLADYTGKPVRDALSIWAPPSDGNDTPAYVTAVCAMCDVSAGTCLTEALVGEVPSGY